MRASRRTGFVMVEALTTLTITALLMASLAGLVAYLLTAGDRAANNLQAIEITSRSLAALDRDIRGASRIRWAGPDNQFYIFNGLSDRILFTREEPDANGLLQSYAIAYQSIPTETGSQLVRAVANLQPGVEQLSELEFGPQTVVYSGPMRARFAYYAIEPEGTAEISGNTWRDANQLPTAVRIEMVLPTTGKIVDQIRVPFQVDADSGCAAPGSGGYCSLVEGLVRKGEQPQGGNGPGGDDNGNQ